LNVKKAGHTGTLDPMASGVLPILIGNTTKLSKYLIEHDKTYIATIKLGEKRDTGDSEGKVIETQDVNINKMDIENTLNCFLGKQNQIPPIYSAIKINGKKLYEYARNGEEVTIPEREITIYKINLEKVDKKINEITFEACCSKGTYIRVLCEDIAEKLGTVGYMKSLVRTQVSNFNIDESITLEELEKSTETNSVCQDEPNLKQKFKLITMEEIFKNYEKIILNNRKKELFLNGVQLTFNLKDNIYNIYDENNIYIGIGTVTANLLKRDVLI